MRISLRLFVSLVAAMLLFAGCGGSTGSTWTVAPLQPTPTLGPSLAPSVPVGSPDSSAGAARTIELELTSSLQIQQDGARVAALDVREGETIRFVLENTAGFGHDFWIGPADQLAAGTVSGLPGVEQWDSGVREFEYVVTADTANLKFGCVVPGHFQTMQGSFTLTP